MKTIDSYTDYSRLGASGTGSIRSVGDWGWCHHISPLPHLGGGGFLSYSSFFKQFGRVVTFSPKMAELIGRNETLLLSQFLFWTDWCDRVEPQRGGWFYKDSEDIRTETSLSYKEQLTARKHLVELGILEEDQRKLEHSIRFKVDQRSLDAFIEASTSIPQRNSAESQTQLADFPEGTPELPQGNPADFPEGRSLSLSEKTLIEEPEKTLNSAPTANGSSQQQKPICSLCGAEGQHICTGCDCGTCRRCKAKRKAAEKLERMREKETKRQQILSAIVRTQPQQNYPQHRPTISQAPPPIEEDDFPKPVPLGTEW